MFTGIIQEIGTIQRISPGKSCKLRIRAKKVLEALELGDSISVDGACLTVVSFDSASFEVDAMPETIEKTTLKYFKIGSPVNLEKSLRLGDKMGGHWVLGHVDGTGRILSARNTGNSFIYDISISRNLSMYLIPKGSVAIDGISLTIIECGSEVFSVGIIPHTLANTTLGKKNTGDYVNLETDIIGKYVHKYIKEMSGGGITEEYLRKSGFM
jgi:riboflavin synthase